MDCLISTAIVELGKGEELDRFCCCCCCCCCFDARREGFVSLDPGAPRRSVMLAWRDACGVESSLLGVATISLASGVGVSRAVVDSPVSFALGASDSGPSVRGRTGILGAFVV